jgi:hypothetical protein
MISRIFQSPLEFDRDECCFRRIYLLVEIDGYVFISSMTEISRIDGEQVKNSINCWMSRSQFIAPECELEFARENAHAALSLNLKTEKDHIVVSDRNQDEYGGFSGTYAQVH